MRTTLTLDDDVAVRIEHLRQKRDASFDDVVNDALRKRAAGDSRQIETEKTVPHEGIQRRQIARAERRQHCRAPRPDRGRGIYVILIDVNILLYATFRLFDNHDAARAWLD